MSMYKINLFKQTMIVVHAIQCFVISDNIEATLSLSSTKTTNSHLYRILMFSFVNFEPALHLVCKNICPEFVRHRWYFSQLCFGHGGTKTKSIINFRKELIRLQKYLEYLIFHLLYLIHFYIEQYWKEI